MLEKKFEEKKGILLHVCLHNILGKIVLQFYGKIDYFNKSSRFEQLSFTF